MLTHLQEPSRDLDGTTPYRVYLKKEKLSCRHPATSYLSINRRSCETKTRLFSQKRRGPRAPTSLRFSQRQFGVWSWTHVNTAVQRRDRNSWNTIDIQASPWPSFRYGSGTSPSRGDVKSSVKWAYMASFKFISALANLGPSLPFIFFTLWVAATAWSSTVHYLAIRAGLIRRNLM